jgi:trigger factor
METKVEKLAKSHIKMTVTIKTDELKKYYDRAYEKVGQTLKIDGFRPGKAPKELVEAAAGQARLIQEIVDLALEENYPKALADNNLLPVDQPKLSITGFPTLKGDENLSYQVEFDNLPTPKIGDYSKISVKKVKPGEPKEADVDKVIEYLLKQKSTFSEIDRPSKMGDRIEVNFDGSVKGVKKEGMASKNHPIVLGEKTMIPGFEEELVGLKKGDKKTFKIKFPKDYHAKELAGETAEFDIEVTDLKEIVLPKEDDKFAEAFGHKDIKTMRSAIKDSLKKEMEDKARQEQETAVLDKVLPKLSVEIPESLIEQETDRMIGTFRSQVESQGLSFDRYLVSIKKSLEDLRKEMKVQAEKNVKVGFLLGEIIKEQKLDVKDNESGRKAIDHLMKVVVKS